MKLKNLLLAAALLAGLNYPALNAAPADAKAAGFQNLDFNALAGFEFDPPESDNASEIRYKTNEMIPSTVKNLDGKKINICGYMIPLKWEGSLVTEFLVVRNTMSCCYGVPPKYNEVIITKVEKGVKPLVDSPIFFQGTLKVGAVVEDGALSAIYSMDCDSFTL
jgi:hypothetical protein